MSGISLLLLIIIMLFNYVNNIFISSITKNYSFIDAFSIGHFIMGMIFYIFYYAIRNLVVNITISPISIGEIIISSVLFSLLYEVFEYLLYKIPSFHDLRGFWYKHIENENKSKIFKRHAKMWNESKLNLLSDNLFAIWGAMFCLLLRETWLIIVLTLSLSGIFWFQVKKRLVSNFLEGIELVEMANIEKKADKIPEEKKSFNFNESYNRNNENWNNTWGMILKGKQFIILLIFGLIGTLIVIYFNNYWQFILLAILMGSCGVYLYSLEFRSIVLTYANGAIYLLIYVFLTQKTFLLYILIGIGIFSLFAIFFRFHLVSRNMVDFLSHAFTGYAFALFIYEFLPNFILLNLLASLWGFLFEVMQYTLFKSGKAKDLRYSVENSYFDMRNNSIGQVIATILILIMSLIK